MLPLIDASSMRDWAVSASIVFGTCVGGMTAAAKYVISPALNRAIEDHVSTEIRALKKEVTPNGGNSDSLGDRMKRIDENVSTHIETSESDRAGIHRELRALSEDVRMLKNIHLRDIAGGAEGVSST